jgi:hypothetical protein
MQTAQRVQTLIKKTATKQYQPKTTTKTKTVQTIF